jgi:pimeloyl-ACP methyl ester carboxylesterase
LPNSAQDHTVVAPDMRGYNLSANPATLPRNQVPGYWSKTFGACLLAVAEDASGRGKVHAGRPRLGGVDAWVFAAMHPEMLRTTGDRTTRASDGVRAAAA